MAGVSDPGTERVLESLGLTRLPMRANADGFYNSFRRTASIARAPGIWGMNAAELRDQLAADLEDAESRARIPSDVLGDAYQSWTSTVIARAAGRQINPRMLQQDNAWRELAVQIRTPGQWADELMTLVASLASRRFNVRIRILDPGGVERAMIGDGNAPITITLLHSSDHWDATRSPE